jgi:prepilin-type N-terminal cleavage/methylation domain-containing protein
MWERMNQKRNEGGFTLIELLIVIIILAILAAIVVFAVGTTGSNSKVAACQSDAKTFETALETYKAEVGVYPGDPTLTTQVAPPTPVPEVGNGQTWNLATPGSGAPLTGEVFGLLGNDGQDAAGATVTATSGSTWTAPNGTTVGPFLRQVPSTSIYTIMTDGAGGVFIYSTAKNGTGTAGTDAPATTSSGMDAQTSNNFDTNSGLCAAVI